MQRNAAVYRIEKTLKEGCDRMDQVYQMYNDVGISDKGLVWNTDLLETLELENLLSKIYIICLVQASQTIHGAHVRK